MSACEMTALPRDIQRPLNFGLYRAQQVGPHLLQQLCEQDKQPVLEVVLMDLNEVHQRLQEHTEHLNTQTHQYQDNAPLFRLQSVIQPSN